MCEQQSIPPGSEAPTPFDIIVGTLA